MNCQSLNFKQDMNLSNLVVVCDVHSGDKSISKHDQNLANLKNKIKMDKSFAVNFPCCQKVSTEFQKKIESWRVSAESSIAVTHVL